jgi:hypothetical protein
MIACPDRASPLPAAVAGPHRLSGAGWFAR